MLMRRNLWLALAGALFIAALGCRSHPELSKTNDEHSGEWRHTSVSTLTVFSIKAGNRIDTPQGEKLVGFSVSCHSDTKNFEIGVTMDAEPESGAVSVGFDGGLSQKTWNVKPFQMKDHQYYGMKPTDTDQADLVRQLRHAKNFQFEFTPKGGKPQRSDFKALNIGSLLEQDENCKGAATGVQ